MMINGRLLLLVVATGLFVRVWTANDRAHLRVPPRARNPITRVVLPPIRVSDRSMKIGVYSPLSTTGRPNGNLEEVWSATSCPMPLPAGIQSGSYRVVSDAGRVARLEMAPFSATEESASRNAVDFSVTTIGSQRWYFIRLQTVDGQQTIANAPSLAGDESAQTPAECNVRPLCTNRKFDFTGYATTNQADEPAGNDVPVSEVFDLPAPQ